MKKTLGGTLTLALAACIWGAAFVAQKAGMEYIGPFTFNGIRFFVGALVLIPVIKILDRHKSSEGAEVQDSVAQTAAVQSSEAPHAETQGRESRRTLYIGGVLCGAALFVASSLQQIGIVSTDAGKAGFITALYMVFVPIISVLIGKRISPVIWLCVVLGFAGLYLLCIPAGGGFGEINFGDVLILLCALAFSGHIMIIDHFSPKVNGVKLSCIQFAVAGLLSLPFMLITETLVLADILACAVPILYAGVCSCGIAYTLQIVGQKNVNPAVASLVLSLESVFALIAGMIILHEALSGRETIGCILMFAAIIITQLPERSSRSEGKIAN